MTTVTLENLSEYGNHFQTSIEGKVYKARQTGKIQTWKKEPEKFIIPVKYGLYESFYIANFSGNYKGKFIENNADKWELVK